MKFTYSFLGSKTKNRTLELINKSSVSESIVLLKTFLESLEQYASFCLFRIFLRLLLLEIRNFHLHVGEALAGDDDLAISLLWYLDGIGGS